MATVVDCDLQDFPIAGAIVELSRQGETIGTLYYTTDGDGMLAIPRIRYGNYTLKVSYLGYGNAEIDFTINTPELELPTILMPHAALEVEAVVKEIKALRASQSGDSLQYNASAYRVSNDADVEGLLQKMPGITIEDGTVTAQGETITKIYIDGREFFGSDVATALKSLPAEVVDKIELFNKLSDEAEFTGVDDGNGAKTINIVTKPGMREGIFGKLFGGAGYEPNPTENASEFKYMSGGSVNIFKGRSRTSVIALFNNLNQQNFSFEDIMGATDEGSTTGEFTIKALPGVANVNAVGVNHSNSFGEDDRVKIQGSYFFNQTLTDNTEQLTRWYEEPATSTIDSLIQSTSSSTFNTNHRFTGRIDVKIDDKQSLMLRPTLSYQITEPIKSTVGVRYDDDSSAATYANGMQGFSNSQSSYWTGYNAGLNGNYRLRLSDNGRTIALGFNATANGNDSRVETSTDPNDPNPNENEVAYTYQETPTTKTYLQGSVNYNEPLSENLRLNVTYKASSQYQESDKRTYDTEDDYIVEDYASTKTTTYAQSTYNTHSLGTGLRFVVASKARITANVFYQNSTFDVNTIRSKASNNSLDEIDTSKKYENVSYSLVSKLGINASNSLKLYVNGYTTTPTIWKFTDNTTSTSYVTAGNSDLEPTYSHRLRAYYTHTDMERGRTLMLNCNATMSTNYIGQHIVLSPDPIDVGGTLYDEVQQYTGWVNMEENYYKFDANASYGLPFDAIRCNLNLNAGVSYTLTPSIYGGTVIAMGDVQGGEAVTTQATTYRGTVTLGSNISENVDFTLSWRGDYSAATNAYEGATTQNDYFNQTASADMKFTFWGGFTFVGNIAYRQYLGITNSYDDRYTLCNAFVGHKVGRNSRGEIIVGVNDIFDQNMSFSRSVASTYTQNKINSIVGRYYSVQYIYNLRAFGLWSK
ncbi:MAG: outer membrane beta-barrel protein [Rikenellaceae bacterium]